MSEFPLGYHITFGTYGTRLHGDERGTVDRRRNAYGEPIVGHSEAWRRVKESLLKFPPVVLADAQRAAAEGVIPGICERGGWTLHMAAVQPDHVHVLLNGAADGVVIRRLLKRWLSETMSERWPRPDGAAWWAESGSVKWVWEEDYFQRAHAYVARQRFVT